MLSQLAPSRHPDLLVGLDWHDDAGVFRLTPDLAVIQTVDFFTPVVDDPFDYGEIAAANSLSDVYAMGGEPLTAMNVVGFPNDDLDLPVLSEILRGGQSMTTRAGAVLVGGHTVKSPELFYGLSVLGRIHPDRIVANSGARPGDRLVLTKPLGTGILTTALKKGRLAPEHLAGVTAVMKELNARTSRLMVEAGAHACTDVTGYGLAGHLHEMTSASGVDADLDLDRIPILAGALEHARAGDIPGGLNSNRRYLEGKCLLPEGGDPNRLDLLFDPQTSGGLLISLAPAEADRLVDALAAPEGSDASARTACVIGSVRAGTGLIQVHAG